MPSMQMLIPQSVPLELADFPLEVVRFDPRAALDFDAEMLVVWGFSSKVLEQALAMPRLRLLQTLTAGVDHVLRLNPRDDIVICNGKGLHDAPTAELAVSLLLAGVRRLHHFRDLQQQHQWDKTAYAHALSGQEFLSLEEARVLVVGFGSIGADIAKRLAPFGCQIEGVAQQAGVRHGYTVHALEDLDKVLPYFDAVVLVLPDTPDTHGFISKGRLERMKRGAWLVNVGRGSAVVEADLVAALESGHLGGAALDVTQTEPLPEDSPLWMCKNLILTPHIAGGGPNFYRKAEALLRRNAQNLLAGLPLENLIAKERGY
jgi:phosphoglycerate dehydrogenase-like enzyme